MAKYLVEIVDMIDAAEDRVAAIKIFEKYKNASLISLVEILKHPPEWNPSILTVPFQYDEKRSIEFAATHIDKELMRIRMYWAGKIQGSNEPVARSFANLLASLCLEEATLLYNLVHGTLKIKHINS